MNYLVPGWHELLDDWSITVPHLEFDDTVSHVKVLQACDIPYSLVITDYQPQLSTKLNQLTMAPTKILSSFDYLQGVDHLDSQIVDYRDFNWPADAYFDFTNFRIIVMVKERPYAKIVFDTQGKILWVDYLENDQVVRRLLMDSRGFVSREELFKNGQPYLHVYYDEEGYWRFKHNLLSDQVDINKRFSELTKKLQYSHLNDLLTEVVVSQILGQITPQEDNLIVTLDDQAVINPNRYLQYGATYSISSWHPYKQSLQKLMTKESHLSLVVDSEEIQEKVQESVQLNPAIIPPFQSRFNLGHSQRLAGERIGLFIESMTEEEINQIVEVLYQRLLSHHDSESLTILSYSIEKDRLAQQSINRLKEVHQGEFILASEAKDEVEEILTDQTQIPKLTIKTHRIGVPSEMGQEFDSLRIIINGGKKEDAFLQVTAISTGIPQLCRQPTNQVKDYQNGLVCREIDDLNKGLDYYLGNLKHWNEALVYNVKLMNRYSAEKILEKWRKVLQK